MNPSVDMKRNDPKYVYGSLKEPDMDDQDIPDLTDVSDSEDDSDDDHFENYKKTYGGARPNSSSNVDELEKMLQNCRILVG